MLFFLVYGLVLGVLTSRIFLIIPLVFDFFVHHVLRVRVRETWPKRYSQTMKNENQNWCLSFPSYSHSPSLSLETRVDYSFRCPEALVYIRSSSGVTVSRGRTKAVGIYYQNS